MPELPEVEVYLEALRSRTLGRPLEGVRLGSSFLVRTVEPPLSSLVGRRVEDLRRLSKRVAIGFEGGIFAVLHLMIAGRLHWKPRGAKIQTGSGWPPELDQVVELMGSRGSSRPRELPLFRSNRACSSPVDRYRSRRHSLRHLGRRWPP